MLARRSAGQRRSIRTYDSCFNGKTILVTGGTGSLGGDILAALTSQYRPREVVILSRDENKQYHMANELRQGQAVRFELGDIRDERRMHQVMRGVDLVIHAAALKHVPPAEREPMEFIKTNILGTQNVIEGAIANEVPLVIEVGTDKAVKPVNAYGMTKALQEKLMIAADRRGTSTRFVGVRYGNVIGSRGSVVPFFKQKIQRRESLPITSPRMTRFLLPLSDAVGLVFHAVKHGKGGEILVKKMDAASVLDLAKAMGEALAGDRDHPTHEVGIRPGEKIHETLVSEDEMLRSVEHEDHYVIHPHGVLAAPKLIRSGIEEYGSDNANRLDRAGIIALLKRAGWV